MEPVSALFSMAKSAGATATGGTPELARTVDLEIERSALVPVVGGDQREGVRAHGQVHLDDFAAGEKALALLRHAPPTRRWCRPRRGS